jgi:peptide/nickel transport system substrate-binding protein
MNRTDHALIAGLVLVLAVVAGAIGLPAVNPAASPGPSPTIAVPPAQPYREGMLGGPVSVNPLAVASQVDRDLVALVFSGLVRLGPGDTMIPDLAERWTVDDTGKTWTFELREGLRWHDGEPLTAADVAFTIETLRHEEYTGPGIGSWREVTVSTSGDRTVRFDLMTPLGGFLQLATQPIAPRHLLGDVAVDQIADDPFGRAPVGSGPFAILELDDDHAVLEPSAMAAMPAVESAPPDSSPMPTDTLASAAPTERPAVAVPRLTRIELSFFQTPEALSEAFGAGRLDVASGLAPADAAILAEKPGSRLLEYPGTTLTAIVLNLRPSHPELRDERVRAALLGGIDRTAIVESVFGRLATTAETLIPPTSWAFDPTASPATGFDAAAATAALTTAGWTKVDGAWRPTGVTTEYVLEVLVPLRATNPALYEIAAGVTDAWEAFGFKVRLTEVDPGTLVVDRLQTGTFMAAGVDVAIGHDPDLYALLASSQTRTGGLNVSGIQDAALDGLLAAARAPGTAEARKAAYTALQTRLATGRFLLPIAWADEVVVARQSLEGVAVRQVADPSDRFWDVLTWRLAEDR